MVLWLLLPKICFRSCPRKLPYFVSSETSTALRGPYVNTLDTVISCYIMLYHVISRYMTPYHAISCCIMLYHMSYAGTSPKVVSPTSGWFVVMTFSRLSLIHTAIPLRLDQHFHVKSPVPWSNSKREVPLPRLQPKSTSKPSVVLVGSLPFAGPIGVPTAPEF